MAGAAAAAAATAAATGRQRQPRQRKWQRQRQRCQGCEASGVYTATAKQPREQRLQEPGRERRAPATSTQTADSLPKRQPQAMRARETNRKTSEPDRGTEHQLKLSAGGQARGGSGGCRGVQGIHTLLLLLLLQEAHPALDSRCPPLCRPCGAAAAVATGGRTRHVDALAVGHVGQQTDRGLPQEGVVAVAPGAAGKIRSKRSCARKESTRGAPGPRHDWQLGGRQGGARAKAAPEAAALQQCTVQVHPCPAADRLLPSSGTPRPRQQNREPSAHEGGLETLRCCAWQSTCWLKLKPGLKHCWVV